MKKSIFIMFLLIFITVSFAATVIPPINNFDIGAKLAKIEHRNYIVMFSTTTCPYCTKFIQETYPSTEVQELIENNYIFIELNEKSKKLHFQGKEMSFAELAQGFGIRGTPSFVFFTYTSTPITILPGYAPADIFSKVLKYISQELYLKNIKFTDYVKNNDAYIGKISLISISKKDAEFILKNDPYALKISNIEQAENKYTHYIVFSKVLASKLKNRGFYNIFLVK